MISCNGGSVVDVGGGVVVTVVVVAGVVEPVVVVDVAGLGGGAVVLGVEVVGTTSTSLVVDSRSVTSAKAPAPNAAPMMTGTRVRPRRGGGALSRGAALGAGRRGATSPQSRAQTGSMAVVSTMRTQVEETIEVIRPALQADGGDIELKEVDETTGIVSVTLVGACGTCPASTQTLKAGIERIMRDRVDGVTEVVNV